MEQQLLKTGDLTRGERLYLTRRRAGRTRGEAASARGVSIYQYVRWERDEDSSVIPLVSSLGTLSPGEQLHLLRRRRDWTVRQLSKRTGLSEGWIREVEHDRGGSERLGDFWLLQAQSRRGSAR